MKRILFILHIPPPVHGSSVVGKAIIDSQVINKAFECSYINLGTSRTVDEIGKNPFVKIGRYLHIVFQVLKQLISNKPNLCYLAITAKGPAFYKDSVIALLAKLFGVQVVYHFHNKGVSARQHRALDNFLYQRVFKGAYAILLSKYLHPDVEKFFIPERVYYCPNGISPLNPPEGDVRQKTLDKNQNEKVEILFLSNLIESKGVFVLLEACKILQQKQLPFNCTFVGGEGNITAKQFHEKVKELGLEKPVLYLGKKYGIEKEEVFSNADIFVHPTYEDCFPLVLLEAMQHKLPVVSTFEGGIPDIVDDNTTGFLVPQKNVEALAEKLELLINDSGLRQKMGEAGFSKFEKEYTIEIFENRLKDILSEITAE